MTKQLGPTFSNEVMAAGLSGLPIAWTDTDDSITGRGQLTPAQNATLDGVIAAHNSIKKLPSTVSVTDFISRWTNTEYLALEKKRRDDIAANKVGNAKSWDVVVSDDLIDMNKQKAQSLKANLVTDGVLTQARADEIFGYVMPP